MKKQRSPKKQPLPANAADPAVAGTKGSKGAKGPGGSSRGGSKTPGSKTPFTIVGIGASAGGLEAFRELLKNLPRDTGFGFVLIQHLDPQHESSLTQILSRATTMPVREVTNDLRVEANQVYVIPPNTGLSIAKGVLKLEPRPKTRAPTRSIDSFFESLAQDQRDRAIGVILSGTATDGTVGLEAIKAEGGITFAQDDSARYDSMPRSAVAAGCVDLVLKPEEIAKELARIAKHPSVAREPIPGREEKEGTEARKSKPKSKPGERSEEEASWPGRIQDGYKKILQLLRNHCGVDFSLYKPSTIERRITRRMVLNKQDGLDHYARFLKGNAKELNALYSDALISVTSFFRNPEAFEVLKRKVFPKLLQQRGDGPLRVWVLGCSTGQEAYSIAMAFMESAENSPRARKLQIFATDLNEATLDKARHGLYPKTAAQDISPERLRRFFVEEEGGYRIVKALREMVVFARQNLISDPPFSRMDLITCRNLLIYLEPGLQRKTFPTFHYALKPEGFLFLGASESIGSFTELFEPVDKKQKIFSRKVGPTPSFLLPMKKERAERPSPGQRPPLPMGKAPGEAPEGFRAELNAQREADRVTVNEFAPPGVLVNAEFQILQFRGPTSAYLQPPPSGKATFDVLKMAREGLMLPLRAAITKARKENKTARKENVRVKQNGHTRTVHVEVIPLKNLRERCFLILFEEAEKGVLRKETKETKKTGKQAAPSPSLASVKDLESELSETRDFLQAVQEQYEAAHEELQASNEEVQSANEELQSINEELETSKEELESANEELTTVNEEMANRNTELSRLNADLNNLQTSTRLPILLIGRNLALRRFSAAAEKMFDLLATDVGRPVSGVRHHLVVPIKRGSRGNEAHSSRGTTKDQSLVTPVATVSSEATPLSLDTLVRDVIDTLREREQEVRDKEGRWHSLRVRPYMTLDNKVDGAVVVLVSIDELKRAEMQARGARDYAEATIRTARDPLVVLRSDLRVNTANEAFYKTFKTTPDQAVARGIFELFGKAWDIPRLRTLLTEILPRNSFFNDFEVTRDFPHAGRRTMLLSARRMAQGESAPPMILLSIEDVTERMRADAATAALAAIVNFSEDAIISKDLAGVITSWNHGAERVFGYTAQEAVGQPIMMLVPPERRPEEIEIMARLKRGEPVEHFETVRLRKNRPPLEVSLTISPIKDATGKVIGASKIARDITELKKAGEALRESEVRYRTLFELGPVAVYSCDASGVIQNFNRRAAELWSRAPAAGDTDERFCGSFKLFRPDGSFMPHEQCPMAEVVSGKISAARDAEVLIERPDGSRITVIVNIRPLKNERGEITGAINCFYDITERKQAEESLRGSEERYRNLFNSMDEGYCVIEMIFDERKQPVDYRFLEVNRAFERQSGMRDVVGKRMLEFVPDIEGYWLANYGRVALTGEPIRFANEYKGLNRSFDVYAFRVGEPDSRKVAVLFSNVTERMQAEEALRQAQAQLADRAGQLEHAVIERTAELRATNQQLEAFVYSIAHDLRAPLRAMQGCSAMLVEEPGANLSKTGRDLANRIDRSAQFMDALLKDLLTFSRVSQERLELATIDLGPIVETVRSRLEKEIQEKDARVESSGPWPAVLAHDRTLEQVLFNLVSNALKFGAPGAVPIVRLWAEERMDGLMDKGMNEGSAPSLTNPQIHSSTHPPAAWVRVWVEDNGIGIALEYWEQIFRLFTRLHGEKYLGTGVGLTIVQKGVERMGGHAGVDSTPGQGSRFWFELRKA